MTALVFAAAANASNPQIAGLQVALRAYGLYNGPIDSIAGPGTARATKAFQRRVGLAPDGRAGPATRRALGPLGQPLFGRRTLRRRMFGWDVSVLQFMLARRGPSFRVYGYFDGATERALRRYQRGRRLAADGVAATTTQDADAYEALLRAEIFPGIIARQVAGFEHIELFSPSISSCGRSRVHDGDVVRLVRCCESLRGRGL